MRKEKLTRIKARITDQIRKYDEAGVIPMEAIVRLSKISYELRQIENPGRLGDAA